MKFRNAVFVVTETCSCPLYNVGETFIMQDSTLTLERDKQVCLILMRELLKVLADTSHPQEAAFACGGCCGAGGICFERELDEAQGVCAMQMNQLEAAEQRASQSRTAETFRILRKMDLFKPLSDVDLHALALMMKLRQYPADTVIFEEGGQGGTCCVVLSGQMAAAAKDK